jgi:hypothetical protein
MNELFKRFYAMNHELISAGQRLSNDQLIVIMLGALSSYSHLTERIVQIREKIEAGDGITTIHELEAALDNYERLRRASTKQTSTAAVIANVNAVTPRKQKKKPNKGSLVCNNCGKAGHIAKDCRSGQARPSSTVPTSVPKVPPKTTGAHPSLRKPADTHPPKIPAKPGMAGSFNVPKAHHAQISDPSQAPDPYIPFAYMVRTEPEQIRRARQNMEFVNGVTDTVTRANAHANATGMLNRMNRAMMDSGATVNLVNSLHLLENIYLLDHPIRLSTVGSDVQITHAGEWPGIGEAYHHPGLKVNIVSLSYILLNGYRVRTEGLDFIVTHDLAAQGSLLRFQLGRNRLFECGIQDILMWSIRLREGLAANSFSHRMPYILPLQWST